MKKIKELQKEENKLWRYINNSDLREKMLEKISRLIEVNLKLEKLSNQ